MLHENSSAGKAGTPIGVLHTGGSRLPSKGQPVSEPPLVAHLMQYGYTAGECQETLGFAGEDEEQALSYLYSRLIKGER